MAAAPAGVFSGAVSDVELVSRIGMNLSAGILIVPLLAVLLRTTRHKHDLEHGKIRGPANAFRDRSRAIVATSLLVCASAVVFFALVQLALIAHVWFGGFYADATVVRCDLAFRGKGGADYYSVAYRFVVPPRNHAYIGEVRTKTWYEMGETIGVRYLHDDPDRNVIDDLVVTYRWPVAMLAYGIFASSSGFG